MNPNWQRARRMTDWRPGITIYPPVLHDHYDTMVYVVSAVVGGIGMLCLLFGVI